MTKLKQVCVKLAPGEIATLDRLAAKGGVSRAHVMRQALSVSLPLLDAGHSIDLTRAIGILEFMQAAMAHVLDQDYPDFSDRIVDITMARVKQYHA